MRNIGYRNSSLVVYASSGYAPEKRFSMSVKAFLNAFLNVSNQKVRTS